MQRELVRAVRRQFALRLRAEIPQFEEARARGLPSECRLYELKVGATLAFYLVLQHHRSWESFTVEVAWSQEGEYPASALPAESPDDLLENAEMSFRLGRLWAGKKDVWWELVPRLSVLQGATFDDFMKDPEPIENLLPKVKPVVEDAIQHVLSDGLPYFRKVAVAKGHGASFIG
jgi:hypothetical protein